MGRNVVGDRAGGWARLVGDGDYFDFSHSVFNGPVTGVAGPPDAAAPPPSTLQAAPAFFTGRGSEVEELLGILAPRDEPGAEVTNACALSGLGGAGKTALALHTAHIARRRDWFPGGTFFADLHGYDDTPMSADRAVTLLLEMLGLRNTELPQSPDAQYARYRSELAYRSRMLIVLDNVSHPRQIWPLLPGENTDHRVLITSRDVQDSLPVQQLTVATLSPQAAHDFIDGSLRRQDPDDHRVADEPDAARELAELCGQLPLALSIGAALLRRRRQRPVATLTAELRNAVDRLRALSTSGVDQYGKDMALRPVFDVMYERLERQLARVFRLIAQAPGDVVGLGGAIALCELPQQELESALEDLVACSLLVPARPFHSHGRWQMHDLVRLYARSVVESDSSFQLEATRARVMLTVHYWQTLQSALALIWGPPLDDVPDVFAGDRLLALAWCTNESAGTPQHGSSWRGSSPATAAARAATASKSPTPGGSPATAATKAATASRPPPTPPPFTSGTPRSPPDPSSPSHPTPGRNSSAASARRLMNVPARQHLTWFKSSYSSSEGGDCIEVAYAWRKSSYSGSEGGDCIEVAAHPAAIHIRDSKLPAGANLTVSPGTWTEFLSQVTRPAP